MQNAVLRVHLLQNLEADFMNDLQHRPESHGVPFLGLIFREVLLCCLGFPGGSVIKNLPDSAGAAGDADSVPGLGRSPGEGNGNPLQYSCWENPMDRGAWRVTVHRVSKSLTWLSDWACMQCAVWSNSILVRPQTHGHAMYPPTSHSFHCLFYTTYGQSLWVTCFLKFFLPTPLWFCIQ